MNKHSKNILTNYEATQSNSSRFKRLAIAGILLLCMFAGLFITFSYINIQTNTDETLPFTSQDQFFNYKNVYDVHLIFTDSAWRTMQPYGGVYGIDGVGEGWMDLSLFYSPMFIRNGDYNQDGVFQKDEFKKLSRELFKAWDTKGEEILDAFMLEDGFFKSSGGFPLQGKDRNGVAPLVGVNVTEVRADLEFEDQIFKNVNVRYKGNGTLMDSREHLKRPLKIDLNDGYKGRNIAGITKLNLHNLITDTTFMNDAVAYRLFRDAGLPGPRTAYAKVYITVSDSLEKQYLGLYALVENVDNNFALDRYGTKKGALFKPAVGNFFEYLGDDWQDYIRYYDPKTPLSKEETDRFIETCKFVTFSSDEEFSSQVESYFDLDNFAKFMAMIVLIDDLDGIIGPGQNTYLYLHSDTRKISFISWDHDHSFGQMRNSQEVRERLSIHKPWMYDNLILTRMFSEEKFITRYHHYLKVFNDSLFTYDRIMTQINELAPIIRPAIQEESEEMLRVFDQKVGWNAGDPDYIDSAEYMDPKPLMAFVKPRHQSVNAQLKGLDEGLEPVDGVLPRGVFGNWILIKIDENKDGKISKEEFYDTFDSWYVKWAGEDSLTMTMEELYLGINNDLSISGPDPVLIAQQKKDSIP